MDEPQSKKKIEKLVKRYEKLTDAEKRGYNEQQTIDHFIRPLFEALGQKEKLIYRGLDGKIKI